MNPKFLKKLHRILKRILERNNIHSIGHLLKTIFDPSGDDHYLYGDEEFLRDFYRQYSRHQKEKKRLQRYQLDFGQSPKPLAIASPLANFEYQTEDEVVEEEMESHNLMPLP